MFRSQAPLRATGAVSDGGSTMKARATPGTWNLSNGYSILTQIRVLSEEASLA